MYRDLPDEVKAKTVEKVFDFANELAKSQTTGYGPGKWNSGQKAPEGAHEPDAWVIEAATGANQYGIPVATYALVCVQIGALKGVPGKNGKTVSGSVAVQKALAIRKLGLGNKQTEKLMADFDIGKDYRELTIGELEAKFNTMKQK